MTSGRQNQCLGGKVPDPINIQIVCFYLVQSLTPFPITSPQHRATASLARLVRKSQENCLECDREQQLPVLEKFNRSY